MLSFKNLKCGCVETTSIHETPARTWISKYCKDCKDCVIYVICQLIPSSMPVAAYRKLDRAEADLVSRKTPHELKILTLM